jgi:hypothetical protein
MSLIGAVVLFRFLKSTALIKNGKYQAGGAMAGFLLIYGALFGSYAKLVEASTIRVAGTIRPSQYPLKVILAMGEAAPDSNGNFSIDTAHVDVSRVPVKVLVLTDDNHVFALEQCAPGIPCQRPYLEYGIRDSKELGSVQIPVQLQRR